MTNGIVTIFIIATLIMSIFLIIIGIIIIRFIIRAIITYCKVDRTEDEQLEMQEEYIDRSSYIIDKIGGFENIAINLSQYCDENQLIVLKNKSIHIRYNFYEAEKFIDFNSIVDINIRVKNAKKDIKSENKNYNKKIIESIVVYIHTDESTKELIFKYTGYKNKQAQVNYNEILKNLNRFKSLLDDHVNEYNLNNHNHVNTNDKSIPQQIKEYKELLDMNAISKEEYETIKMEILSK